MENNQFITEEFNNLRQQFKDVENNLVRMDREIVRMDREIARLQDYFVSEIVKTNQDVKSQNRIFRIQISCICVAVIVFIISGLI